jgi:hypothetical protein
MKLFHVYIFNTIVAIVYALGLLIVPATIMTLHGISSDPSTLLMARYFGVGLLGIGLVTWLARNSDKSQAQDAISLGFLISYVVGLVVSLQATLAGQMNAVGWLPVVIYLVLIVGLGYFRFRG